MRSKVKRIKCDIEDDGLVVWYEVHYRMTMVAQAMPLHGIRPRIGRVVIGGIR